jgi:squalene-associated FAD-dependent desaturase
MSTRSTPSPRAAIVGGGLAGLAAGCALSEGGFHVTLFERRPYLGGRASSYQHPGTGEVVDNCQHVLFGSCTNLIDFYQRIDVLDKIRWSDQMTFLEPGGRATLLKPSFLPAPLQTAPSFLRFPFLSARDKLVLTRALAAILPNTPKDTGESFLVWLQRHGQSETAIQRFWKPVLVSALSEDLDRISVPYAAQVVRESLKSTTAARMGIPKIPLTELYNAAQEFITSHGGEIRLRCSVESFRPENDGATLSLADGAAEFDFVIVAVPFFSLSPMLPQSDDSRPLREKLAQFESSPITGIHLWFDRQITDLDHAVLLDRTIQWMFHKSKLLVQPRRSEAIEEEGYGFNRADKALAHDRALAPEANGSYVELVVSASKDLVEKSKPEIVELALKELREFLPGARHANLLKSTVIKEVNATYSPRPGIDLYRPANQTVWPRIFLAGDWTATSWPATMEGAVRSGYMAAECVARAVGLRDAKFVVPGLPATGFMRLFA